MKNDVSYIISCIILGKSTQKAYYKVVTKNYNACVNIIKLESKDLLKYYGWELFCI